MIQTLTRNPLLLGLAALAVVLAVVLAVELRLAAPAARDAALRGARPVEAKLLPPIAARPPEQAYPEVTTRPLFTSTRRPAPEVVAATTAPAMVRGKFMLQGVIVHGDQRTALLRERSSGRVHRVESGREVDGMKVVSIENEAVTLGLGDEREVVPMIVQKGGGPALVAATPGAPAAPGGGAFPAGATPGPFARAPSSVPGSAQAAAAQAAAQGAAAGGAPMPTMPAGATPNVSGGPPFGPPPAVPAPPATAGANVPSQPPPQAGPAFPMSPEELLARRRARRAQQN